ncbi:MAG TPA: hypothetical protein VH475_03485 [Tepidisphaeraceae bacterium]|jgi:hypothetical protein
MTDRPPTLDYAPPQHKRSWWRLPVLWELICLNMWSFAILGTFFVAIGVASFAWPSLAQGLSTFTRPVVTPRDKIVWVFSNALIAATGLAFVRWHVRQWRKTTAQSISPPMNTDDHR